MNTQDTVSLLDNDEAKTLSENRADRMTVPTAYAIAQGAWQSQKYGPGNAQWLAAFSHSWEETSHRGALSFAGSGGRIELRERQQHGPRWISARLKRSPGDLCSATDRAGSARDEINGCKRRNGDAFGGVRLTVLLAKRRQMEYNQSMKMRPYGF